MVGEGVKVMLETLIEDDPIVIDIMKQNGELSEDRVNALYNHFVIKNNEAPIKQIKLAKEINSILSYKEEFAYCLKQLSNIEDENYGGFIIEQTEGESIKGELNPDVCIIARSLLLMSAVDESEFSEAMKAAMGEIFKNIFSRQKEYTSSEMLNYFKELVKQNPTCPQLYERTEAIEEFLEKRTGNGR